MTNAMACFCLSLLASVAGCVSAKAGGLKYVNTQIGTTNLGHVFAGATLPYGMAKAVADVTNNNRGGFSYDGQKVSGFSHMHDSGTGGGSSMGNFPFFPYSGCTNDTNNGCAPFGKQARAVPFNSSSVKSSPGYWSIELASNIVAEMTVTKHAALYRFTFPEQPNASNASLSPMIIVDLTDLLDSIAYGNLTVNQTTGRMTGDGMFKTSFGETNYYTYFCADFAGASLTSSGIWQGNRTFTNETNVAIFTPFQLAGGFARFSKPKAANQIYARMGLSFVSHGQACRNAEHELPRFASSFDKTAQAATSAWSEKLDVIAVSAGGASDSLQETFWSGIYRTMISPQDYTGENPLWKSTEPYFDSFYCIWDSFRAQHPLLTILDPTQQTRMVRSLIDIYRHEGYLPDCRMQLSKGYTQGGSNAEVLLTDSYLKNITDGVDWATAFEGMIKDAEVEPRDWYTEGRGRLTQYKKRGYAPIDAPFAGVGLRGGTVSRTLEYAYDDFCIAEMAKSMNNQTALRIYKERASNWKHVFNANQTSSLNGVNTGFKGFAQPRKMNGDFAYQDPTRGSPANIAGCCGFFSQDIETYEGSCWSYSFFAPQDMAGLITKMGGSANFTARLDYLHEHNLLDIGNEQAFLPVFQYHYAGRPGRSSYRAHRYIPSAFNTSINGIPGNDDSGAMGAFAAWAMMGLFPNPGQNVYLIIPPFFESVSIKSPATGATAKIVNQNFDPTYQRIYIQNATLNGKPYTKNWVDHSFFLEGKTLSLTLGRHESSTWGKGSANVPPSLSTTGFYV